ncbi:hypothetical protein FRC08_002162 [Ceratobasidium sp. 394]|nr:hypothetical protein FRC08_002162 [Ceratobasidium sp. 394]
MECNTHSLANSPLTALTSCQFQKITKIFAQKRADIICGFINGPQFTGEVAVKAFLPLRSRENEQSFIQNELRAWRLLCRHPHIASFVGTAPANLHDLRYMPEGLVSDYYVNGDLAEFLRKVDKPRIDSARRLLLLVGVARGLQFIHGRSIIHGDLKASNVLVDAEGRLAKICDFGSSTIDCGCYDGPSKEDQEGTTEWESPELWESGGIKTKESDVWAFGCVALEVQMGIPPWDPEGDRRKAWRRQVFEGGYPAREEWLKLGNDQVLHEVWKLMQECWNQLPSERPTSDDLLPKLEGLSGMVSPA